MSTGPSDRGGAHKDADAPGGAHLAERGDSPWRPRQNWIPERVGGLLYLAVMAATVIGLVVVVSGAWRPGVRLIGLGLVLAGGLRVLLSDDQAGMLAVRNRRLDAALTLGAGAVALLLASWIRDPLS
ncbi:MAG: DUF3017 domain-containing protein [Nocardioides sp.]